MTLVTFLLRVLFAVGVIAESQTEDPVVETTHGKVRGVEMHILNTTLHVFYGIPFAKPPVGELRFRRPEPAPKWKDKVLDATAPHSACFQKTFVDLYWLTDNIKFSEDCLVLNIWVPANAKGKLVTMLWIFGGGFRVGSINDPLFQGYYLAAENNVIVASMNYRLESFGFFYTGSDSAPGNQGLLDQLMAMKWIRDNIDRFGGDHERITLFGESAGSVSVNLHLLSPLSRDLFQYGIMESGMAQAKWAISSREYMKSMSLTLARKMGCSRTRESTMMKCMQKVDAKKIIDAQVTIHESIWHYLPWSPVVDGYFLPSDPEEMLRSGRVKKTKVITGINKDDGSIFAVYLLPNDLVVGGFLKACRLTAAIYGAEWNSPNHHTIAELTKSLYETLNEFSGITKYVKLTSELFDDCAFKCPAVSFASSYTAQGSDVYLYTLRHRPALCIIPKFLGVGHSCELQMVFGHTLNNSMDFTRDDKELGRKIRAYWTTFAKTGNPNSAKTPTQWPVFDGEENYLILEKNISVAQRLKYKKCAFWNRMVPLMIKLALRLHKEHADGTASVKGDVTITFCLSVVGLVYSRLYVE